MADKRIDRLRKAIARERGYLFRVLRAKNTGGIMAGDIEGAFHRLSSALDLSTEGNVEAEIDRLRIGQAVIAKQVGFYKPETPDFEFVSVPLGILRRALHGVPPPYPEDGV